MKALLPILFFLIGISAAFGDPILLGTFVSSSSGKHGKWEAKSEQIQATPSWSGSGQCPFDGGKLADLALAYAKAHAVSSDGLRMTAITFSRFNAIGKHKYLGDKWSVSVNFLGGSEDFSPPTVRLLTDGTIIDPIVEVKK